MPVVTGLSTSSLQNLIESLGEPENASILRTMNPSILESVVRLQLDFIWIHLFVIQAHTGIHRIRASYSFFLELIHKQFVHYNITTGETFEKLEYERGES